jgi:hypothetical protein
MSFVPPLYEDPARFPFGDAEARPDLSRRLKCSSCGANRHLVSHPLPARRTGAANGPERTNPGAIVVGHSAFERGHLFSDLARARLKLSQPRAQGG